MLASGSARGQHDQHHHEHDHDRPDRDRGSRRPQTNRPETAAQGEGGPSVILRGRLGRQDCRGRGSRPVHQLEHFAGRRGSVLGLLRRQTLRQQTQLLRTAIAKTLMQQDAACVEV